jgi:L-2,4-diaminobutyrate decarboxylase
MCDAVGFPSESGGTMTSGGTEATFTALLAARAAALPDSWLNGITEPRPVVLCGEHTHYAVTRAVAELGLGMRSAIVVPSTQNRMNVGALERE